MRAVPKQEDVEQLINEQLETALGEAASTIAQTSGGTSRLAAKRTTSPEELEERVGSDDGSAHTLSPERPVDGWAHSPRAGSLPLASTREGSTSAPRAAAERAAPSPVTRPRRNKREPALAASSRAETSSKTARAPAPAPEPEPEPAAKRPPPLPGKRSPTKLPFKAAGDAAEGVPPASATAASSQQKVSKTTTTTTTTRRQRSEVRESAAAADGGGSSERPTASQRLAARREARRKDKDAEPPKSRPAAKAKAKPARAGGAEDGLNDTVARLKARAGQGGRKQARKSTFFDSDSDDE